MHATQPQGGACPEPHPAQPVTPHGAPENHLIGLLTDPEEFRAWVAGAALTAAQPPAMPQQANGDGYVVTESGLQALADTGEAPGTAAQVLRDAALYLQRHGWIQGAYYDATFGSFTPPTCLVGAIGMVCYGGPVDAPAQHFDDPGFLDFEEAVLHLDRYLLAEDGSESYEFNDAKGRQLAEVLHVLRQAADTPAQELIDAIRAIDAKNAQVATMVDLLKPGGIFGAQATSDPADMDDENSLVDCLFCGAPGGYPYCQGSFGARMSCADVVAADNAEQAAQDGDVR